jgi:hypothetical protein
MDKEDEDYEIQKPQIKSREDEEQMKDLAINTILMFELQMIDKSIGNNCRSEEFGMQRSEDDLSRVSIESTKVFT